MNIHKAYMSRLGITEQEVATTKSTLTNQSYTSYMLDEAYKGGPLEFWWRCFPAHGAIR